MREGVFFILEETTPLSGGGSILHIEGNHYGQWGKGNSTHQGEPLCKLGGGGGVFHTPGGITALHERGGILHTRGYPPGENCCIL